MKKLPLILAVVCPDGESEREPIRAKSIPRCSMCGDVRMLTDGVCDSCGEIIKHDDAIIDVLATLEDITQGDAQDRCADAASMLRKLLRRKT